MKYIMKSYTAMAFKSLNAIITKILNFNKYML